MEVRHFLEQRTAFIRWYYDALTAPLIEDQRKIEAGDEPYEPPYFDPETDDPADEPFQEEWSRNRTGIDLIGATCVSMLSESLKVYFTTWEKELGVECQKALKKDFNEGGFIRGYRECFGQHLKTDWSDCPADFAVLEQVVLARNDTLHVGHIFTMAPAHGATTRRKYPSPFFARGREVGSMPIEDAEATFWFFPRLSVSRDGLFEAVRHVELLAEWMEERLFDAKFERPPTR